MVKEWYIRIGNGQEGPYGVEELRSDRRITPETLVWKEGFDSWVPIGSVDELSSIFVDATSEEGEKPAGEGDKEESDRTKLRTRITPDGLVVDARREPPNILFWLAMALLLSLYLFYKLLVAT